MKRKRSGILGLVFLLLVVLVAGGVFVWQQRYIRYHAPLIQAELASAEGQGGEILERIGAPPGSTVSSPVKGTIYSEQEGMWSNTPSAAKWTSAWDIPGTEDENLGWYRQRLVADGWEIYNDRIPSNLETLYWKDKWLLTIGHNVSFPTDNPPHVRFQFLLVWDYWHRLEQTSQDNAGK